MKTESTQSRHEIIESLRKLTGFVLNVWGLEQPEQEFLVKIQGILYYIGNEKWKVESGSKYILFSSEEVAEVRGDYDVILNWRLQR